MLVLTRKKNQDVVIGDDVFVSVVEIRGDKVRLGFTADRDVPVHRREVFDTIKQQGGELIPLSQRQSEQAAELAAMRKLQESTSKSLSTALADVRALKAERDALRRELAELQAAAMLEPKGGA